MLYEEEEELKLPIIYKYILSILGGRFLLINTELGWGMGF